MSIRSWFQTATNTVRKAPRFSKQMFLYSVFSRYPRGTHVFEKDWDVLLLLDACRVDALQELSVEYEFLDQIDSIMSLGSTSPEWITQTFSAEYADELSRTAYLSNNAHSEWTLEARNAPEDHRKISSIPTNWDIIEARDIGYLEHVWKYADFIDDPDRMCTSPEVMTDRMIEFYRERGHEFDRVIVHYEQPHRPYYHTAMRNGRDLHHYEYEPWEYLRNGGDRDRVWESYLEEARAALDSIETLLKNMDAETVAVSADHGEGMGEREIYGHPGTTLHPVVKEVPWAVTSASDEETRDPSVDREESKHMLEDHLEAMGYL